MPHKDCPDCNGHGYTEYGFCHCPAAQVYIDKLDDHTARTLAAIRQAEIDAFAERAIA